MIPAKELASNEKGSAMVMAMLNTNVKYDIFVEESPCVTEDSWVAKTIEGTNNRTASAVEISFFVIRIFSAPGMYCITTLPQTPRTTPTESLTVFSQVSFLR